jgi:polysaccharide export outer membrane protein
VLGACTPARTLEVLPVANDVIEAKGRYLKQYVLAPGDRIEVSVWQVPEVSRIVQVRPDGQISLPTVSNVTAAGRTFDEVEAELTTRLSERLREPLVTLIAVEIRSANVYVLGDVRAPRAVPLRDAPSALEAIAQAGGLLRSGAAADVSLIRLGDDGILRAIPIETEAEGQPAPYMAMTAVQLQADDIIFVPEGKRSEAARFLDDFVGGPLAYLASSMLSFRIMRDEF